MGATDSERFDIYFRGECVEGADVTAVRAALGRLFRADEATLDRLFSGELQRIKRGVDRPTAEKYRGAMESAGARPLIQPQGGAARTDSMSEQAAAPAQERGFDVAPVGSDVLRPEERPRHDAPSPATDHLDLAPVGATLHSESEPVAPMPAPEFDVAEVGSDLGEAVPESTAVPPDTHGITLAAPEHDLRDCAPGAPHAPPPTTDHLTVAAPGGELINEDERDRRDAPVPSTDHISLAETPDTSDAGEGKAGSIFDRG